MTDTANEVSQVTYSLEKMETITKVLSQTNFDDKDFNPTDYQNLCAVLEREIDFAKSKISKIDNSNIL